MNNKLLVRPNPLPGESLLGYIIRLCEYNGYKSPSNILKIAENADYRYSSELPKIIHRNLLPFANITQKSQSLLEDLLNPPISDTTYKFFGSSVIAKAIQALHPKLCPFCLQERPYYRMVWDLSLMMACPIHKCLMLSNCPECNKAFKLNRNHVCKCECGFDLRDVKFLEDLPKEELRVAGHIYLQLGISISQSNYLPMHNPLINFPLIEFTNIIKYFAGLILKSFDPEHISYRKISPIYNYHPAVSKALSIFDNFPENYLNFVNDLIVNDNHIKNFGICSFIIYHTAIYKAIPKHIWTFLYKAYTENIDSLLKNNSIESSKKRYNPTQKYILISDAEKNFKVSKSEFKYLLSSNQLKVRLLSYEKGKTLFVNTKSYLKLKIEKESWIKETDLAIQLDISIKLVKQLAYDGYIPVRIKGATRGKNHYSFDGDLFIKLLSKLRSKIKPRHSSNELELLDFGQIEKLLDFDIKLLSNFLGLCLKGQIKPVQELLDKKGIRRFLFRREVVKKFISSKLT